MALLLLLNAGLVELAMRHFEQHSSMAQYEFAGRILFISTLITLLVAVPAAAWAAHRLNGRFQRISEFARHIAQGDHAARLAPTGADELSTVESQLNRAAERVDEDFTDMESRRDELAAMLDSMQEAVVAVAADGQVRWSNAMMRRIAGTQIRVGRSLVHSVRDPELLECIRNAMTAGEACSGRSTSLVTGRSFEISAAPLPSGGALAVLHDVTPLELAEKSRRDFIANVSHELRTPLTSIQGYVETLCEEPTPDAATTREFLGIIQKNASRMNRLTQDLLALASVESPDYKLVMQSAKACDLLRDAIDSLGGLVADSGIELQSSGAPDATVLADPDAMNQVFGNLIENAVKYGKSGKRIHVGAELHGDEVEFVVQDYGPGIAFEHLDRIFERFYRVDKARSRESGGTGLGLAIVRHILQAHGGRIWAQSELGSGTAFHFTLPIVRQGGQAPKPESAPEPASESA
ncbi:MAG: PAS domain-containing protein [Acidobacteriota bacterium]|nr:PAS domain-containing protein [Acidobacteriota bacterium]